MLPIRTGIAVLTLTLLMVLSSTVKADTIGALLEERLGHMKDVAAFKWQHQLPVEDLLREQVVVENAVVAGLQYGMTRESTEAFFQAQIEAAKAIQRYWFAEWQAGQPLPTEIPDLQSEVRPALISLGNEIMTAIGEARVVGDSPNVTGLEPAQAEHLLLMARQIGFYSNRLEQILESGVIRIGTTGDYAPFSFKEDLSEQFTGLDIQLGEELAETLDARVIWVKTSWPTLMNDFESNQFDIAMSGISRTLKRQRTAYFSIPYYTGGKTAIGRCNDQDLYQSLSDLDQANVRFIVNPGGTNEKFARANLKQAVISVFPDNRTIFEQIVEGQADVMITDDIEVRLQSARHTDLCALTPGVLYSHSTKSFLLPQDEKWKHYVDLWLEEQLATGSIETKLTKHLH